jgi:predicted DNA-binding transcriptional regulator
MFEEIINSSKVQISERLNSPIIGSFVASWSLWNYKFLVILFSEASVQKTFELIEAISFPDTASLVLRGVVFPALTAAAYIFLYPYPAKVVYEFTRKRQKEINDVRRRIEDETPLTLEESRKIRSDVIRIEAEHSEEIDRKDREIERLKEEITSLRAPSPQHPLNSSSEDEEEEEVVESIVTPSQLSLLRQVELHKGKGFEKFLIARSAESQIQVEFDLGELVKRGLLTRKYSGAESDYYYQFTHEGRSYLISHRDEK